MKHLYQILPILALFQVISCTKNSIDLQHPTLVDDSTLSHEEIVLGDQLNNPYTVENVKAALFSLYPTKAPQQVNATDLYVRFLPKNDNQLSALKKLGIPLLDHPMDYDIVCDGDFYHDPTISADVPTWQYSVVPADFKFPFSIEYEILDECFIASETSTKADDGIDWDAVEAESFRLTGNEAMLIAYDGVSSDVARMGPDGIEGREVSKAQTSYTPSGRVTIIDDKANGGQPFGVAGVRVDCNVFVKYATTYCDRDGYFTIPKKFSVNPRYRLVFKNSTGFSIGFNSVLYPASVSTLGKNSPAGVNVTIDSCSERKLFRRCVVNNAVYDYFARCGAGDLNIQTPPSDLCIWTFDKLDVSSAVMLHHGTVFEGLSANKYFTIAAEVVKFFTPDITLGTKDLVSYSEIYELAVHELAHASHFAKVGKDYWNNYIQYIGLCALEGKSMYGDGQGESAGHCAVGEMWAYFMQQKLFAERYPYFSGRALPQLWFHPVIFSYLSERGFTVHDIFEAMNAEVTSVQALKESLLELYPARRTMINQVFGRYE